MALFKAHLDSVGVRLQGEHDGSRVGDVGGLCRDGLPGDGPRTGTTPASALPPTAQCFPNAVLKQHEPDHTQQLLLRPCSAAAKIIRLAKACKAVRPAQAC